jgi:hypothetical protein
MLALATAGETGPVKDARYRVRHGGKVALRYFDRKGTFERFNSSKADRLEPNLAWVDHREPTDGGQVDIAFSGARRLLLITRTLGGRWFCTVPTGSGNQTAGAGASFSSVDTTRECIGT